jgi:tetraacyldisaccharide 4'-kinase
VQSQRELQEIWYGGAQPGLGLRVLSVAFRAVSSLRRLLYQRRILKRERMRVPVVVVGNIAVGGTGKTPLVIALVGALRERGFKPGVISRGFGGAARELTAVDAKSDVTVVGDEAKLIFDATHAPMMIGRRRVDAARRLIERGDVDIIVSDDGLQHYRLARDIEICVIDGQRRFGNKRALPAGPLREPASRLATVDFVVVNGSAAKDGEIAMRLHGDSVVALRDRTTKPLDAFRGRRVHAVAGIGNPSRFFAQLGAAGIDVVEHAFADHHAFAAADFDFADAPILMTEKDAVKCRSFAKDEWWSVPVAAELPQAFFDAVAQRVSA